MLISVVVPCMNEEASIPVLVDRLAQVVAPYGARAEIVLVDDGSTMGPGLRLSALKQPALA